MKPNQLHTTDLSFFVRMTTDEARASLDGKTVFLDSLGFDVRFENTRSSELHIYVKNHYASGSVEKKYRLHPTQSTGGEGIIRSVYDVVGSYIKHNELNDEPKTA